MCRAAAGGDVVGVAGLPPPCFSFFFFSYFSDLMVVVAASLFLSFFFLFLEASTAVMSGVGVCCVAVVMAVYDILIPKLCSNGEFEKGRRLWKEAEEMGIALQCSSDVLDPSITKVFELRGKEKDLKDEDSIEKVTQKSNHVVGIRRKPRNFNKKKQKRKPKKKVSST